MLRLLALALLLSLPAVSAAQPAMPRRDRHGDPLPPGAIARLGTERFRFGGQIASLAFSPDGKRIASSYRFGSTSVWDAETGKELYRLQGQFSSKAPPFTLDGKQLVLFSPEGMRSWNVEDRKLLSTHQLRFGGNYIVSPIGRWAALHGQDEIIRVMAIHGNNEIFRAKAPAHGETTKSNFCMLACSPEGKRLAAGQGGDQGIHLRVWDAATGKEVMRIDRQGGMVFSLALSKHGSLLAVTEGVATLLLFDVTMGKELRRLTLPGNLWCSLVFYPADDLLAVSYVGGVDIFETATGKRVRRLPGSMRDQPVLAFSPDGKTLAVSGPGNCIRLWDICTGNEISPAVGPRATIGEIAWTQDSRTLATAETDGSVRLWRITTGDELFHFTRPRPERAPSGRLVFGPARLAFVDGGRTLAAAWDDGMVCVWDATTGKERRRQEGTGKGGQAVGFSADGTMLVTVRADKTLRLEDVAAGKVRRRFEPPIESDLPDLIATASLRVALSPDGRTVAVGLEDKRSIPRAWLWEASSGKRRRNIALMQVYPLIGHEQRITVLHFSPDGQTLAIGVREVLHLWDLTTNCELRRWRVHHGPDRFGVAFSPDGTLLAMGGAEGRNYYDAKPYFTLINVATGDEVARVENLRGATTALAFSPDGKTLAVGSADTTTTLWDVAHLLAMKRRGPLTAAEMEALWSDLASADAERADRAGWALTRAAERAVPLLTARLTPVPMPDERRLAKLVAAVGDVRFDVRRRATAELEELGDVAGPALQKALDRMPELETRRRLEQLIAKIEAPVSDGAELQRLRAVEVLERVGGAEARRTLVALAAGAPGARLTREARAALRRAEAATSRADAQARRRPADGTRGRR